MINITYSATIKMYYEVQTPHVRGMHDKENNIRSQSFGCPLMLQVMGDCSGSCQSTNQFDGLDTGLSASASGARLPGLLPSAGSSYSGNTGREPDLLPPPVFRLQGEGNSHLQYVLTLLPWRMCHSEHVR